MCCHIVSKYTTGATVSEGWAFMMQGVRNLSFTLDLDADDIGSETNASPLTGAWAMSL